MRDGRFMTIYRRLLRLYGPQGWWPVTPPGELAPRYTGGPADDRQRFEVAAGAILTQNTAWANASRAIESLNRLKALSPRAIDRMPLARLAVIIRSAGYYNQKAERLKTLASFFLSRARPTREALLALRGVGPETADSIMLYAFDEPYFVVDAYTRRLFGRLGLVNEMAPYEEIRLAFERNLPPRPGVYGEYHALVVEHGKRVCKKVPNCKKCLLITPRARYLCPSEGRAAVVSG